MRFFLKTRRFKICMGIIALVIAGAVVINIIGGIFSPGSSIIGVIISPFQDMATGFSNAINDFGKKFTEGNALLLENQELKEELDTLRKNSADLDSIKRENEFFREYLEIKDKNPDFTFCDARLISVDKDDSYRNFIINKGSASGISQYDPVIIGNSLVGYVSQVGLTTSKVTTILSPEITLGANDSRTGDAGILTGTADYAVQKKVKLYNLARSCNVVVGDTVVTSGEGLFPEGFLIGSVDAIKNDTYTSSLYATITPFVDFDEIRNVMVITHFDEQGVLSAKESE